MRSLRSVCAAIMAAALLSGCSALRIAYGTAPDLAYWWLDRYVDFNGSQAPRVHEAIDQWFAWNRRSQLPDYAALLVRAEVEVRVDTTSARACAWQADLVKRARTAFDRIAPAGAELMLTITPEQIQHIERRYAKFNDEYREAYLQPDPARRAKAALKRTVDRAEQLYGDLNDAQIALVVDLLARSPFDPDIWFAERRERQQAALQMLRRLKTEAATKEQALAALRLYADQLERSPRVEYRRYAEPLADFNCAFAAKLHNSTTAAQRQVAAERLAGWEGDLRAIAAAPEGRGLGRVQAP
jgi:hypothetical protein